MGHPRVMANAGEFKQLAIDVPAEVARATTRPVSCGATGRREPFARAASHGQGDVLVNGSREKASLKLRGGERIVVTGEPHPVPLKATAEDIPLDVVFEDASLAVVNKPAGMMVHAGAGQTPSARNQGTLVNALLYRFKALSSTGASCGRALCTDSTRTRAG